jgi:hypothetical protein
MDAIHTWLSKPIGNLAEGTWKSIWRSDAAQDIRDSIIDGSFRYCSPRHWPPGRAEITDDQIRHHREQDPSFAVFSHDRSCNLRCPACRKEQIAVGKSEQTKYDTLGAEVLNPLMEICKEVKITGSGDPFGSIHFRNLLAKYCATHTGPRKITLHTNGVLFDKKAWESLTMS